MQRVRRSASVLGAALLALLLAASACGRRADDCYLNGLCGGEGASTGTGGGTNCDPTKGTVDTSCGVFVSNSMGDDSHGGTREKPLKTLSTALAQAGSGRVYACGESFTEPVKLTAGVTLHGALDCSKGWAHDPNKKTVLTADADTIPLVVASTATGAGVLDFAISAAPAVAHGGSSIAVLVDHATATFTRCDLLAQAAAGGDAGVDGGPQPSQADPGVKGDDAGMSGALAGGTGASNTTCSLKGGNGGDGGLIPSADGSDGTQGDGTQGGAKGTGQTSAMACTPGASGDLGEPGAAGLVTPGFGTIDANGYHGIDGQDGIDGTHGKSGGGGGGSKATATVHGAGGGGGGAGGCGGKKGIGGRAGGSSIALVSIASTVTLTGCSLGAGKPGDGGSGGDGQFGQLGGDIGSGGKGGLGAAAGCNGGKGGDGGNGGNGSGGLGGHSLGIGVVGTAPVLDAATKKAITLNVTGGAGGKGGNMDADANHGNQGVAKACWDFVKGASCEN